MLMQSVDDWTPEDGPVVWWKDGQPGHMGVRDPTWVRGAFDGWTNVPLQPMPRKVPVKVDDGKWVLKDPEGV